MTALPTGEVPTDLTVSHMFVKACDLYDGFYDQLCEEDLRDARTVLEQSKVMDGSLVQERHTRRGFGFCFFASP